MRACSEPGPRGTEVLSGVTRLVFEKVLDMLPTLLPATDEALDPETSEPMRLLAGLAGLATT